MVQITKAEVMYKYDFTVVMAVYNTEPFLREAIDSLIGQTLGFSHIQLILVDDGSTDGSGGICDEFKIRYPENVIVIHKENGGVSSARNAGIPLVKGKYLNYLDSDDKMESDAFEKVLAFFEKHEEETDVAAIPVRFFDAQSGEHIQNHKFSIEEDVVKLDEHPFVINLSCSYSFFKTESTKGIVFDTELAITEDGKYALSVLLKKMKLGLVRDTTYWYRKRSSGEASALQSLQWKTYYYLPWLEHFANWALDYAKEQLGYVPKFVQYEVMYDLQWRLQQTHIPIDVLPLDEQARYREGIKGTIRRIDTDVIIAQRFMSEAHKVYAIMQKNGRGLDLRKTEDDIELVYGQEVIASIAKMKTVLEFLSFDKNTNSYSIEGFHLIYGIENELIEPCLIVDGRPILCDSVKQTDENYVFCGEEIAQMVGFRASVSAEEAKMIIRPALKIQGMMIERTNCEYGFSFPISDAYEFGYANLGQYVATVHENDIVLTRKRGLANAIILEKSFLNEVWGKKLGSARKGIAFRLLYPVAKAFKHRKLWVVSGEMTRVEGKREAILQFLQLHKPSRTRVVFAVEKDNYDYHWLSKEGKCIDVESFQYKMLLLLCDVGVFSHEDQWGCFRHHEELRNLYARSKHVFLQDEFTKDDLLKQLAC